MTARMTGAAATGTAAAAMTGTAAGAMTAGAGALIGGAVRGVSVACPTVKGTMAGATAGTARPDAPWASAPTSTRP